MGEAEVIRELDQLSAEELAEVRARLDELARRQSNGNGNASTSRASARVRSPRLANPAQSRDFVKHVTELPSNA